MQCQSLKDTCQLAVIGKGCLTAHPALSWKSWSLSSEFSGVEISVISLLALSYWCHMWFYSLKPLEQTKTYPTSAISFLVHLFFSFLQCLRSKSVWDWVSALTLSCNPSPWPQACLCPGHQCLEASKQAPWTTCGCLLNLRSTDVLFCKIGSNELMRVDLRETMWKNL